MSVCPGGAGECDGGIYMWERATGAEAGRGLMVILGGCRVARLPRLAWPTIPLSREEMDSLG